MKPQNANGGNWNAASTAPRDDGLRAALDAHDAMLVMDNQPAYWACKCGDDCASAKDWRDHREAAVRAALSAVPARAERAEAVVAAAKRALRHAVQRNHDYSPRGCDACFDAESLLGDAAAVDALEAEAAP